MGNIIRVTTGFDISVCEFPAGTINEQNQVLRELGAIVGFTNMSNQEDCIRY